MAFEIIKELDTKKVEAWDRIHDKRKLYGCERCGARMDAPLPEQEKE